MPRASVVLDTNVIVSAHLNADGLERFILDLALAGQLRLFYSHEILSEYERVLPRKKFGIDPKLVAASLRLIQQIGRMVTPTTLVNLASDPDDNKFLECSAEAGADYLVTGNKRHFPAHFGTTAIVNAKEFISRLVPLLPR